MSETETESFGDGKPDIKPDVATLVNDTVVHHTESSYETDSDESSETDNKEEKQEEKDTVNY